MSTELKLVRFTREVSDVFGRRYRLGESPEELTGRPRDRQVWRAWLCLAAISPLQYLFGFAVLGLPAARNIGQLDSMWLLAMFVVVQACTAVPTAWLNRGHGVSPALLVVIGGVLAAVGLATLGRADGFVTAVLGYSLLGGVGAGLVYSTAVSTAGKWFPDDRVVTVGFVSGGFACGAVPSILVLTFADTARAQTLVFDVLALVALLVVTVAGSRLVDPPRFWWPGEVDPQNWAVDGSLNRSLPANVPTVQDFRPTDAIRTAVLGLMWLIFALVTAVSLFATGFLSGMAVEAGLGSTTAGIAAACLAAVSGVGRSITGRFSDTFGRSKVLALVLVLEGVAQLGLALSGRVGSSMGVAACAVLAGLGGGAFYAIFANLALEFFGQTSVVQNQAALYSAKAIGGLVGIGGGVALVGQVGYAPVFVVAGVAAIGAGALVPLLKQPGKPEANQVRQASAYNIQ